MRKQIIVERIQKIKEDIGKSCLIAVSKYHPSSDIVLAYSSGHMDFGESRVQELIQKREELEGLLKEEVSNINWHFIGRLQSNKVGPLLKVPGLRFIHSIDSMKLLETLYKKSSLISSEKIGYFLQVNTSHEEEKGGLTGLFELTELIKRSKELSLEYSSSKLYLAGLMTIGSIRTESFEEDAKKCFDELSSLRDEVQKEFNLTDLKLSMGMSQDYKWAVERGSDFIRVGSAIFKC